MRKEGENGVDEEKKRMRAGLRQKDERPVGLIGHLGQLSN